MHRFLPRTALFLSSTLLLVDCSSPAPTERSLLRSADAATSLDRAPGSAPTAAAHRAEEAVRQADGAEVRAFLARDPAALARLWSDEFVVTNPFNQFRNKEQVLGLVTSGILAFTAYDRQIEYIHAYHDIVVVAGRETVIWAGTIPLAGQTSHLRYTAVWSRHGNEWQEVARHANIVAPGAPAGPPIR